MATSILGTATSQRRDSPSSLNLALTAARVAIENRAKDVVVLDLREITPIFDYFVIATGASKRQLHAISETIDDVFTKELGEKRRGLEGYQASRWIVMDYGDVVVHIFDEAARDYYTLEELWSDARKVPLPELKSELPPRAPR